MGTKKSRNPGVSRGLQGDNLGGVISHPDVNAAMALRLPQFQDELLCEYDPREALAEMDIELGNKEGIHFAG